MYDHVGPTANLGNIGSGNSVAGSSTNMFVMSAVLGAFIVRAWTFTFYTDCTPAAPLFTLFWRPTIGSDTGRLNLGTMTQDVSLCVRGNQLYKEVNRLVKVGEEMLAVLTTGTGSTGFGMMSLYCSPTWGVEGNVQLQKRLFNF